MKQLSLFMLLTLSTVSCMSQPTTFNSPLPDSSLESQEVRPSTKGTKHISETDPLTVRPTTKGTRHQIFGQWTLPSTLVRKLLTPSLTTQSIHSVLNPMFNIHSTTSLSLQDLNSFSAKLNGQELTIQFNELSVNALGETVVNYSIEEVILESHQILALVSEKHKIEFRALISAPEQEINERIQQDISLKTSAQVLVVEEHLKQNQQALNELSLQEIQELKTHPLVSQTQQRLGQAIEKGLALSEVGVEVIAANKTVEHEIKIVKGQFNPIELTVELGHKITWIYEDQTSEILTSREFIFLNQSLEQNQRFSFTFKQIGTFRFKLLNSGNIMTIVVKSATN